MECVNLRGDKVVLRAVELTDIEFMYGVENDLNNWGVSNTTLPFSQYVLKRFIESQSEGIHVTHQLRLMITTHAGDSVGTIDLFEYDPFNHRAGVGIFIIEPQRRLGYAADALRVLHSYSRDVLQLHQLWCNIESDNAQSMSLFASLGYSVVGSKRDWLYRSGKYCDEIVMQCILT